MDELVTDATLAEFHLGFLEALANYPDTAVGGVATVVNGIRSCYAVANALGVAFGPLLDVFLAHLVAWSDDNAACDNLDLLASVINDAIFSGDSAEVGQ